MNEQIKQMAMRLHGLREDLEMTIEEVAVRCGITPEELERYESGDSDIPMNFLCNAANVLGVEPLELFSGDAPNMSSYWLVRKGKGPVIERQKAYKYQALAMGFKHAKASPFIVTVDPKMEKDMHLNTHEGQEFNLVLKGTLLLSIAGKELILNPGDSIYFDSAQPHGMKALNGEPARFLAIII
ncbi:MAG: helix-turn-helix transcriptional regulator [Bacteroidaceae bacterium]|nr:helix-turn-helix transcriptional regulator [Bacteroidaceae bacterium]